MNNNEHESETSVMEEKGAGAVEEERAEEKVWCPDRRMVGAAPQAAMLTDCAGGGSRERGMGDSH